MKKILTIATLSASLVSFSALAGTPVTLSPAEQNVQKQILQQLKEQNNKLDEVIKELKKQNSHDQQDQKVDRA